MIPAIKIEIGGWYFFTLDNRTYILYNYKYRTLVRIIFATIQNIQHADSKKFIKRKYYIGMIHGFKAVSEMGLL